MSTGLPIANTPRNTSADISTSTMALCMRRRRMKTVTPLLFHRVDVEDLSVLVRVALEGEVVVHPPEGHLVVEGNDAGIFDAGLRRLLQKARALLVVDRRECFLKERVQLLIIVAVVIGVAISVECIVGYVKSLV